VDEKEVIETNNYVNQDEFDYITFCHNLHFTPIPISISITET